MGVNGARQTDICELKANIASTLDNISAILGTDVGREELTLEEQVRNVLRDILAGGVEDNNRISDFAPSDYYAARFSDAKLA